MLILRYFTEIVGKLFDGKAENVILYQPRVELRFAVAHIAGAPIPNRGGTHSDGSPGLT